MNENNRKPMNDVIVPQNEVIRRPVIVPEERPTSLNTEGKSRFESNPFFEKFQNKKTETKRAKSANSHGVLWALVFVVFLGAGFAVASYFSTAIVEITPITRNADLNNDFIAVRADADTDGLVFEFATSTEELTKEIPATVETKIQKKAFGTVVIYNAYSSASQKLIKNTRLEDTATHKIYRIDNSITVPGAKVVSGKVTTPGSIEAVVYADVAGEEYNTSELVDFSIPGFKGDPRYTKFYARSKPGYSISGGFAGTVKVPSDDTIAQAREELKQDLKKVVVEKTRADIPDTMTFFPGSMVIKFEEVPQDYSEANASKVSVRASVSVFFFDTETLTQTLADAILPNDKEKEFKISNISTLKFDFVDPVSDIVLSDITKLKFHLSGTPVFAGVIDIDNIRQEIMGKNKSDLGSIIANQTSIFKADATFRPAWNTVFPTDPAKITVKILTK